MPGDATSFGASFGFLATRHGFGFLFLQLLFLGGLFTLLVEFVFGFDRGAIGSRILHRLGQIGSLHFFDWSPGTLAIQRVLFQFFVFGNVKVLFQRRELGFFFFDLFFFDPTSAGSKGRGRLLRHFRVRTARGRFRLFALRLHFFMVKNASLLRALFFRLRGKRRGHIFALKRLAE